MFTKSIGAAAVAAAMFGAAPASAASFMFNGNTATSGTYGLASAPLMNSNISVTATAWSTVTNAASSLPVTAYLGMYGSGLGATNRNEGNGQTNNSHTVSNTNGYDFIRLEFSTAVKLTGITLTGFNVGGPAPAADTDAWVSYGGMSDGFDQTGWNGYLQRGVAVASGNASTFTGATFSRVWLIAADRSGTNLNDGFKIGTITAVPQVPEPATWLSMIVGFGAIGGLVRKRARVTAKIRALMTGGFGRKLLTGPANA